MAKRGVNGAILKLLRARDYQLEVVGTGQLSESMRTVRLRGQAVMADLKPRGGEYLRCWFPGLEGEGREYQRGYTIADVDPTNDEFSFYFLLHAPSGPACVWGSSAQVGQKLSVTHYGARTFAAPVPAPRGYVFVADAAGMPYVDETIKQLPADTPVQVWLSRYRDSDEDIPLVPRTPNVQITWVEPGVRPVLELAEAHDWAGWALHITAEVEVTKAVRKYALKSAGVPKSHIHCHAYWLYGRPMP